MIKFYQYSILGNSDSNKHPLNVQAFLEYLNTFKFLDVGVNHVWQQKRDNTRHEILIRVYE